jgi:hypothetical protein
MHLTIALITRLLGFKLEYRKIDLFSYIYRFYSSHVSISNKFLTIDKPVITITI